MCSEKNDIKKLHRSHCSCSSTSLILVDINVLHEEAQLTVRWLFDLGISTFARALVWCSGTRNRKTVNCNFVLSENIKVSPPPKKNKKQTYTSRSFYHPAINLEILLCQNQLVSSAQQFMLLTVGFLVGGAVWGHKYTVSQILSLTYLRKLLLEKEIF